MAEIRTVKIDRIQLDKGTLARAAIDLEAAKEYGEAYEAGEPVPDPIVFEDEDDNLFPGDGHHRITGRKLAGRQMIQVEIRKGTLRDAQLFAAGANTGHGIKRSNKDKQAAVSILLADPEWAARSDNWIAQACKVSDHFVSNVRAATSNIRSCPPTDTEEPETRLGMDGKERPAHQPANVGDAYEGRVLCSGCKRNVRVGRQPKAGCPDCKKLNAKPTGAKGRNGRSRNGAVLFDSKLFESEFGSLYRQIDKAGRPYNAHNTPEAEGLRRLLNEWKESFRKWHKTVSKKEKV